MVNDWSLARRTNLLILQMVFRLHTDIADGKDWSLARRTKLLILQMVKERNFASLPHLMLLQIAKNCNFARRTNIVNLKM